MDGAFFFSFQQVKITPVLLSCVIVGNPSTAVTTEGFAAKLCYSSQLMLRCCACASLHWCEPAVTLSQDGASLCHRRHPPRRSDAQTEDEDGGSQPHVSRFCVFGLNLHNK